MEAEAFLKVKLVMVFALVIHHLWHGLINLLALLIVFSYVLLFCAYCA